jgi:hypothetical protein
MFVGAHLVRYDLIEIEGQKSKYNEDCKHSTDTLTVADIE